MIIVVISDSHGNISNLNHVMGFAKHINADAIIHAGDWNNAEAVKAVLSFKIPLYSVLGNADLNLDVEKTLVKGCRKFAKDYLFFRLDGKKIGITHKPSDVKKYFKSKKPDIIFCGHLHSSNNVRTQEYTLVRPGAIENGNNFVVYNTETAEIEFISES